MDLPKLAAPAMRALSAAGINQLEDFSRLTRKETAEFHGMGPNALVRIEAALAEANMTFKDSSPT